MKETKWKSISLIEGIGEVSNYGWFKYYNWHNYGYEKITIGSADSSGHLRVGITINGKQTGLSLHRLVALAFVPIPDRYKGIPVEKLEVHHKDFNKKNNSADNLEWLTRAEHILIHCGKVVEMLSIDWEHEAYFASASEAHRETGISQGNISSVCRGEMEYTGKRNGVKHRFRYINKEPQGI